MSTTSFPEPVTMLTGGLESDKGDVKTETGASDAPRPGRYDVHLKPSEGTQCLDFRLLAPTV